MPIQTNILEYLEATAPRLPQKLAYSNGVDGVTFSQLHGDARRLGSALLKMGLRKAPVAVLMEKHPTVPVAFFGVVYAGGFYIPMDTAMPAERMQSVLEQSGASAIIVDEKNESKAISLHFAGKVLKYQELVASEINKDALDAVRKQHLDIDPLYIVFTSGSTGTPKGVAACHRSVIDYSEALCDTLGFSEESVFANQAPLFFDAPLKELIPVIKYGATAYLVPQMNFMFPMLLCKFLNEHRINTVCWVVSALTMLSSTGALLKDPPKYLKTVAFGSEVFPLPQYRIWRETLPNATFFNLYGPTEATGMSCWWRADRELEPNEPIPVGYPFRNTGLLLINEEGKEAKIGEVGEIYLRGTCVTLGYYGDAQRTAEAFVQNPLQNHYPETVYKTGDNGMINRFGELVFLGRRDGQIKLNGYRIELGEIEAAAAECEGIERACCVYRTEKKQIVMFYVGATEESALITHLKARLPKYMVPSVFGKLSVMPFTPNGKIDRKYLKNYAETEMFRQ